jgi:hypothetical protein
MDRPHGMTRYRRGPDEHGNPGKGCRCDRCREVANGRDRHRRRMIAYGRWEPRTDATGTRRRLQALMRCGYSLPLLAGRLGCSRQELRLKLHERGSVTAATARAVAALYDELWDRPPPESSHYEKVAASRTRNYARNRGYPLPLAWDDDTIDDPAAQPAPGWERSHRRVRGTLTEDAAWLLGGGEAPVHVAGRLGVREATLERELTRERARQKEAGRAA